MVDSARSLCSLCALTLVLSIPGAYLQAAPTNPPEDPKQEALAAHNKFRKETGVPELDWDPALASFSQEWATHLCRDKKGALIHRERKPGSPGENLWVGGSTDPEAFPVSEAVKTWFQEKKFYSKKSGRCSGGVCGHFTQLVWRKTTHVGCGVAQCKVGEFYTTIWACNYSPAGNIIGERAF